MFGKKKCNEVMKNDKTRNTVKENKPDIIFFKNSPIEDETSDVFDFRIKATAIEKAINNGANMIALIGDYGTGKSSLTKILYNKNKEKYTEPIYINLWDTLTTIEGQDEQAHVSYFTKSFLYQLALGNHDHTHFSRYINQRLSKNYGKLSFALAKRGTLWWVFLLGISLVLFYILKETLLPDTISKFVLKDIQKLSELFWYRLIMLLSSIRYIFLLVAGISIYKALKNNNILFSLWDSQGKIEPTDTDCFEVFEEIITNIAKKCSEKKQLIIIEDLDRSDNAKAVLSLLKEIYRFNNLLSKKEQSQIVFIISLKSEASLIDASSDIGKDKQKAQQIYSKIFDYTVWVRPIHFANAKEIILSLLIDQLGEEQANKDIPKLYWLMQGDNITVREIKDRLNETYLLYQSLSSRRDNSSVDLRKCACVVYLQRQYPDEFLNMTSKETALSNLIEKIAYSYSGDFTKIQDSDFDFILQKDENGESISKNNFIKEFKKLLEEKNIENDYRMYFYNYPAASYVMNTKEKNVYDYITFDNSNVQKNELDEAIEITINMFNGFVIVKAMDEIEAAGNTYGAAIFQNALLFSFALTHKQRYTLESFKVYFQQRLNQTAYADLCNIIENNIFDISDYTYARTQIIDWAIAIILDEYKRLNKNDFIQNTRSYILRSLKEENIPLFRGLFITTSGTPIIEVELLKQLQTPEALFSCLNFKLINQNNFKQYFDCISTIKFNNKYAESLVKSVKQIPNLTSIPGIEEYLLQIFLNNKIWDSDLFTLIYDGYTNKPEIILDLVSKANLESLTDNDYIKINNLQTNLIKDETLLKELEKRNLFMSSIYSRVTNNIFENFDFNSKDFLESLPTIAQNIFSLNLDCFIELRKVLIQNANLEHETVYKLFNNSYPFISESELNLVKESKDFYWVIDFPNVNIDNCILLCSQCNKRNFSGTSLFDFFNAIFLDNAPNSISDINIIWKILETIDFEKNLFNTLPLENQETLITFFDKTIILSDNKNCIRFIKDIKTHIEKYDKFIQNSCSDDSELLEEYIDLCKTITSVPDYVIDFLISNKIETSYPKFITDGFLKKKEYHLYILGKSFEEHNAFHEANIPISYYQECFFQNDEYFELCKNNSKLVENIYLNLKTYEKIKLNRLLCFVGYPQNYKLIKEILELSDNEQKRKYLMEIKEIATYADSKKFCDEITEQQYAELFRNDRDLYLHVLHILWTHDGDNYHVKDLHISFIQKMARRYNINHK